MGDVLGSLPLGGLSAGAVLTLFVLAILRGNVLLASSKFVPRQQLLDKQAECDAARADAEKWREAHDKVLATTSQLGISVERLILYAETTNHAIVDIRELARTRSHEEP